VAAFLCVTGDPVPATISPVAIQAARRQHLAAADKLTQRIINCANAVRLHLAGGQPAGPAARQIGSDVMELLTELGRIGELEKMAAWARQVAA
jgi:hypothetical protein